MDPSERGLALKTSGLGSSIRQTVMIVGLVFSITLAVIVAKQMSTEAMAVVIGIICGVAASIPTSLLLLLVLSRRDRAGDDEAERRTRRAQYPPVVVIQGGSPQALPQGPQAGYWPMPTPGPSSQRQFHVVGDDDFVLDA